MSSTAVRVVAAPVALALGTLSRLRRARVFHPRGVARHAEVHIEGGHHPLATMAGTHRAIVRTSRGLGTPEPLPDIWGIAIRLLAATEGAEGPDDDIDLLLATTGTGPVARHLLVPTRRPAGQTFSTLLPFTSASGRRSTLAARPITGDATKAGDRIALSTADVGAPWKVIGEVTLGAPLPEAEGQALRFSPWNTPPGLELAGRANEFRRPAYLASQAARPDT